MKNIINLHKKYPLKELCELFEVPYNTIKKADRRPKIFKDYEYEEIKEGRSTFITFTAYKDSRSDFLIFCEKITNQPVQFSHEKNIEILFNALAEKDLTIYTGDEIASMIDLDISGRQVNRYLKELQSYNLLPKTYGRGKDYLIEEITDIQIIESALEFGVPRDEIYYEYDPKIEKPRVMQAEGKVIKRNKTPLSSHQYAIVNTELDVKVALTRGTKKDIDTQLKKLWHETYSNLKKSIDESEIYDFEGWDEYCRTIASNKKEEFCLETYGGKIMAYESKRPTLEVLMEYAKFKETNNNEK